MPQSVTFADLKSFPPEVTSVMAPAIAEESPETLELINQTIAKKRDEARDTRKASGIERIWQQCEEAYIGIDDANRAEFAEAKWAKPMSTTGPVTTNKTPKAPDYKSTVFVRLTARYVDAGTAKLSEILLSPNDRPFSFSEMPVPHLIRAKDDRSQVIPFPGAKPLMRDAQPHELAAMGAQATPAAPTGVSMPPALAAPSGLAGTTAAVPAATGAAPAAAPPQVPLTVKDFAEENIELARKKAKKAEDQVWDWLVRSQYNSEARKIIFDAARIGTGVLKGPVPDIKRKVKLGKAGQGVEIDIEEKLWPVVKWCDPWNIFPDPACGENIHNGDYVIERDYLSARQLRKLRNQPGYIAKAIDQVLEEGPGKIMPDSGKPKKDSDYKNRYEVWYYYGVLTGPEYLCICAASNKALGQQQSPDPQSDKDQVYAIVTVVNDSIIKAVLNPLESGEFPYHSIPWQRRAGHWAGIGVGEQVRAPQDIVNAATRAMLNNAGKSAGSMIVIDRTKVMPADGQWVLTPDKIFWSTDEGGDVRAAFNAFQVPNVTQMLQSIIDRGMQLAEEATSIPLITQGESGATTPDTFGAAKLQDSNANQLLRSIGYAFDDFITEPLVRQMYEWYLLDPEIDADDKAEFEIDAHGSIALVDRAIENQAIGQMGNIVLNPVYGFDPKRWAKQYVKANRLNPEDFQYSDEEQQRIDAAPPPDAPQVAAAKINQDTQLKLGVMKQQGDAQSAQSEERIAAAAAELEGGKLQVKHNEVLTDATIKLHELQSRERVAMLEYANRHQMNLDQVRAQLAGKAMELQTERDLNADNNAHDMAKHRETMRNKPPVQVPGRAGNGRAFSQAPAQ